jgi:uncharacterized protein YjbI with pentapeptide repeats
MKVTDTDGKEYTIESEASLRDANLSGADLVGADLKRANLRGTNLNSADLIDTNLSGAIWSDDTVFPEGFEIPEKSET